MSYSHAVFKKIAFIAGIFVMGMGLMGVLPPAHAELAKPRIIGGVEVPKGKYPFMASLKIDGHHYCGGSLLDAVTVITAAHCVRGLTQENAERVSVTVGSTLLNDTVGVHQRRIQGIAMSQLSNSDLALIYLDEPINVVVPILLPTKDTDALYQPGQTATVMGWGNTDDSGLPYFPNRLREVDVPILSTDECAVAYPEADLSTFFCAGARGKDSCQGDSGGPIIRNINGRVYQVGVVSFGKGCAEQGAPGAYVNLSSSKLWESLSMVWSKN